MKATFLFPALLFLTLNLHGQNLVPNPSFEATATTYCGIMNTQDFNDSFTDWYSPTGGSPDLYFTNIAEDCYNFQPNSQYAGPVGLKGNQIPRTGDVMVGVGLFSIEGLNQREYIQTKLSHPLIPGHTYQITYYVSLADFIEFSIGKIGVHFSTSEVITTTTAPLDLVPQLENEIILGDAQNWMMVTEIFEADDVYEYMTIGNFRTDDNTMLINNPNATDEAGTYGAYYFLDDIAVSDMNPNSVKTFESLGAKLFPNPSAETILIRFDKKIDVNNFKITNIQGQTILHQSFSNTAEITVNIADFPGGTYYVSIESEGDLIVSRFVKI